MVSYENYTIKNNVFGTLSAPISSLATTIQLWDWQGQRFSVNQLATLENIENWKVMKREIVLITAINWDVLTVTRKYAPCPANNDANTQWKVSFNFSTDDVISAYITKEHFDNIKDSLDDLYENWNNRLYVSNAGGLTIHITWWNVRTWWWYAQYSGGDVTLTDNATNYVMIDWAWTIQVDTTNWDDDYTRLAIVTTSWWLITNITRWKLDAMGWTYWVDIHNLPQKIEPQENDEILLSDSADGFSNKKAILSDAVFSIGIDCLSERVLIWEKYTATDQLFKQITPTANDSTVEYNVWDTNTNTQIQIQRIASGTESDTITLKVKTNWTPTTALHCDVYEWESYDVSSTEIAWKATWTALATSSLASSNFSSSWQEVTFTLSTNIGGTKGQLLSIVVYQENNTVSASDYYIIGCDVTQWSEAFRLVAYDNNNTYTTSYLMPYCTSDWFTQYLLSKVDDTIKTISAKYSKETYVDGWTISVGVSKEVMISGASITNDSWDTVSVSVTYSGSSLDWEPRYARLYADNSLIYTWGLPATKSINDWATLQLWIRNRYNSGTASSFHWDYISLSYSVNTVSLPKSKDYFITWYSYNGVIKYVWEICRRAFLGQYSEWNYLTSIGTHEQQ